MLKRKIHTQKTTRYFVSGEDCKSIDTIWIVLHGYGQLADEFLSNFDCLLEGRSMVVAPEGMHRFYLKGFQGKVGASWMTKIDREDDIFDYINELEDVYNYVIKGLDQNNVKINLLGFSQGSATACRWAAFAPKKFSNLILCSGVLPTGTDYTEWISISQDVTLYFLYGHRDPIIDKHLLEEQLSHLKKIGVKYNKIGFKGTHTIDESSLKMLKDLMNKDQGLFG